VIRRWVKALLLILLLLYPPLSGYAEFINGDLFVVGVVNYCTDAGSTDTYACTPADTRLTAYVDGSLYGFKANTINTGPATFNYNGLGARTIKKQVGGVTTDLSDGDIQANQRVLLQYDAANTSMQMLSTRGSNTLTVLNPQTAAYPVTNADFQRNATILVASGTFTITLVASGATQPSVNQSISVVNYGSGVVTIARNGQNINGQTTSLVLPAATALNPTSAEIVSDGTNYFASVTGFIAAASTTASGQVELAINTETTTGTDATRAVTPDSLAHSDYGKRYVTIECVADATALTVATGLCYFPIHPDLAGWLVVGVRAYVGAVVSSSGVVTVSIDICGAVATGIRCSGTNRALLSTNITIDANEDSSQTAATPAVINTANDDLAADEWVRFNVTGTGTSTQGLYVTIVIQKP
jgi:hypothetical protein